MDHRVCETVLQYLDDKHIILDTTYRTNNFYERVVFEKCYLGVKRRGIAYVQ